MKRFRVCLILKGLIIVALVGGCSAVLSKVAITSEPEGANVSIDGKYIGQTPLEASRAFWTNANTPIIAEKQGCKPSVRNYDTVWFPIPDRIHFTLDCSSVSGGQGSGQQVQQMQQMQGPTVIITTPNQPVEVKEVPTKQ